MRLQFAAIPGFLPGLAISILLGFALSAPVGRALGVRRPVAWLLVASVGAALSATLTPSADAIAMGVSGVGACDLGRIGLASLRDLMRLNETSLNVWLFVPLGLAIGLIPRSRRKALVVLGAIALPFAIEAVQLVLTALDRTCQSADVIDNLTGLVVGLAIGSALGGLGLVSAGSPPDDRA